MASKGVVVLALSAAVACVDLGPLYGHAELQVGGTTIHFKRENRGLSYDVLAISMNGELHRAPDKAIDYVDPSYQDGFLFLREEDATLHIYTAGTLYAPANPFPVKVVVHELSPGEYSQLRGDPTAHRVRPLHVPLAR